MGRGRAKAKQTKVARDLKYNAPMTDLEKLRSELSGPADGAPQRPLDDADPVDAELEDDDGDDDDRGYASHR